MWYHERFKPSRPRQAKGGIKAQSKQGAFSSSWWGKRWIQVLESFDIGARLGRGRSYARKGQVLSIDIGEGEVAAKVQGSRPTPYKVTIRLQPLDEKDWKQLAEEFSKQAVYLAKLLAGEMPAEIEQVFDKAGLSLFPTKSRDLQTDCSCPDWSNPCKHVAAVYYLLAEEFDRDPFLLFRLRGKGREELLAHLGRFAPRAAGKSKQAGAAQAAEPLVVDAVPFWDGPPVPDATGEQLYGLVQAPPVHAALLRRLGIFPFWRGIERPLEVLPCIYETASELAAEVFVGGAATEGNRLTR